MEQLAQTLVLQQVVLGESQVSIVDRVRFRTELGVDVEQTLERFLPGQLVVKLGQKASALGERFLEFAFLVWVVYLSGSLSIC